MRSTSITTDFPSWSVHTIVDCEPPLGHDALLLALKHAARDAEPLGLRDEVRRARFAQMMLSSLLPNQLTLTPSEDNFTQYLASSIPLSGISDAFASDEPNEPLTAIDYVIEFIETLRECYRTNHIGAWHPRMGTGDFYGISIHTAFDYWRLCFREGVHVDMTPSASVLSVSKAIQEAVPCWMQSMIKTKSIHGATAVTLTKPLALGDWQLVKSEQDCKIELVLIGPYIIHGQKGRCS